MTWLALTAGGILILLIGFWFGFKVAEFTSPTELERRRHD